jgi:hypothetical protein
VPQLWGSVSEATGDKPLLETAAMVFAHDLHMIVLAVAVIVSIRRLTKIQLSMLVETNSGLDNPEVGV